MFCALLVQGVQVHWSSQRSWGEAIFSKNVEIFQGHLGTFGYVLWNMSPYVLVETGTLLYSIESLVAEFGGTLGLFLGFSFMALWDGLEVMVKILGKLFKKL